MVGTPLVAIRVSLNHAIPAKHTGEAEDVSPALVWEGAPEGHGNHLYYFFLLLALDKQTSLTEGLTLPELLQIVEPHLLGMNRLVGAYQRG